jgi:hypothetical protein
VPFDLDPADLAEVRRRVVEPVLAAMLRPGELTDLHLGSEIPQARWWDFLGHDQIPSLRLRLTAGEETFEHSLANPGFWLNDATDLAEGLVDRLQDWICETRFGWGQLRSGPEPTALPPAPGAPPGVRTISVHLNQVGDLPLWENGRPADEAELKLSSSLRADLAAWQMLTDRFVEALIEAAGADDRHGEEPNFAAGAHPGSTAEPQATAEAGRHRRGRAGVEWRTWVVDLEAPRDALVARLRDELGDGFLVPAPPRLPHLDQGAN